MSVVNVYEYLERIKYSGSTETNLENLEKLCEHHATNVPTDTLNLFGGPGKQFDLHEIYRVMIKEKRGGFCYELNVMFGELIKELGYDIAYLAGQYYYGKEIFSFPFNHMIIKVTLNDEIWLVDVGFGAKSFYLPKKLEHMLEQSDITGTYRYREMPGCKETYLHEKYTKTVYDRETGKQKYAKKPNISKSLEQSEDWIILQKFTTKGYSWEDFKQGWDEHLNDPDGYIMGNSFLMIFHLTGVHVLWGYKFLEIDFIDSKTEKRNVTEIPHETEEDKKALSQFIYEKFQIKLSFELKNLRSVDFRE